MRHPSRSRAFATPLALLACACLWTGCRTSGGPSGGAKAEAGSEAAAEIEGRTVTVQELDDYIKDDLFAQRTHGNAGRVYSLRADALDRLLAERAVEIEAERAGLSSDAWLAQQLAANPVTDAQVQAYYTDHKDRMGKVDFQKAAPYIRRHLEEQRRSEIVDAALERAKVEVFLQPPRVEVAAEGPSLGPADAPVTIIEFGDFQCPYCRRAAPVVRDAVERHAGQVRLVFRYLPLERIHPRARAAAEAAACAQEQGRFWPYHDKLFDNSAALGDADLLRYGADVGLDSRAFAACIREHRGAGSVEHDLEAARAAGISSTPTFIVNGRLLLGFQTADALERTIQAALAASPKPAAASAKGAP